MNCLATAAHFETKERLRLYPRLICDGKITADVAVMDTEVWDVIAVALEAGTPIQQMLGEHHRYAMGWFDVRAALARAVKSRANACAKHPDDNALATRSANVEAIAAMIDPVASWYIGVTESLRTQATNISAVDAQ